MLSDKILAHIAKDVVQEEPRDFLVRERLDADRDRGPFDMVREGTVRNKIKRVPLDIITDRSARESEAHRYRRLGDCRGEKIVRVDDVGIFEKGREQ